MSFSRVGSLFADYTAHHPSFHSFRGEMFFEMIRRKVEQGFGEGKSKRYPNPWNATQCVVACSRANRIIHHY